MNIPDDIWKAAQKLNLDWLCTGGGIDYIYKPLGVNADGSARMAILGDAEDAGSPDSLKDRSEIHLILSEDWTEQVSIPFKTAAEGLRVLATITNHMMPIINP